MTFAEFYRKMLETLPLATVEEDNDGQLVVYTGMKMGKLKPGQDHDDGELVDFESLTGFISGKPE